MPRGSGLRLHHLSRPYSIDLNSQWGAMTLRLVIQQKISRPCTDRSWWWLLDDRNSAGRRRLNPRVSGSSSSKVVWSRWCNLRPCRQCRTSRLSLGHMRCMLQRKSMRISEVYFVVSSLKCVFFKAFKDTVGRPKFQMKQVQSCESEVRRKQRARH